MRELGIRSFSHSAVGLAGAKAPANRQRAHIGAQLRIRNLRLTRNVQCAMHRGNVQCMAPPVGGKVLAGVRGQQPQSLHRGNVQCMAPPVGGKVLAGVRGQQPQSLHRGNVQCMAPPVGGKVLAGVRGQQPQSFGYPCPINTPLPLGTPKSRELENNERTGTAAPAPP